MTTASDNIFPKLILDGVTSAPSAPSNDNWKLYAGMDGIYARSSNTTVGPFISAASVSSPTYSSWTPTLTADGGNPNLGSTGTATGKYMQLGKFVHAYGRLVFGGTGISAGSGTYEFLLPVAAASDAFSSNTVYGTAALFDSSANTFTIVAAYALDANECRLIYTGGLIVTSSLPFTWATGDQIILTLFYEAA